MEFYVAPGSININFTTLLEGGALFDPALQRLQTIYLRANEQGYTPMIAPLWPDYELERKPGSEEMGETLRFITLWWGYLPHSGAQAQGSRCRVRGGDVILFIPYH